MGSIQIDSAIDIQAQLQAAKAAGNLTCLTIRTGSTECVARFYPALFQLTLVKNGVEERIELGFSGSRLLERLVRNPGEVVDRDDLMQHAWPDRVVGQGSLNQQIYTLRQILLDESNREIIQTLPRRGYLLNPRHIDIGFANLPKTIEPLVQAASVVDNLAVETVVKETSTAASPPKQTWRMIALAALGCCAMLGAFLLGKISVASTITAQKLQLSYSAHSAEELTKLQPFGRYIEQHLSDNISGPLRVVLGVHDNSLDLICLRPNGSSQHLHLTITTPEELASADLSTCLQ